MENASFNLLFLLLILISFPPCLLSTYNNTAKTDREALILFKNSIQSDPNGKLSNWLISSSPCNWTGVWCSDDNRVTHVNLSAFSLVGDAVDFYSLSTLDSLLILNLSSNSFNVNSSSLFHLPHSLEQLDLSSSGLAGFLPDYFLSLYPNLLVVNLSYNNLTGSLPMDFMTSSENLQVLDLSMNHFTGSIPSSLSNCTSLNYLNMSYNSFVGEIPVGVGALYGLKNLDLSNNHISSSIPWGIGNCCQSLQQLSLSNNNISGTIPYSLFSCSSLRALDLANNNLSGPIPNDVISNLSSLEFLLVSNNFFSGQVPSSVFSHKTLRVADFSSNKLSSALGEDICYGESTLEELRIPDNMLTGSIPPRISNCSKLRTIDMSINYLTGPIPRELGQLANLEQLMVWFNGLDGTIPAELGKCHKLKNLILNNNFISGNIPINLFNSSNLEWISLTSNRITGQIPREFGMLSRLAVLQLANNSLSGEIPRELGNCSSLVWLDLNSNRLGGKIPPRLGRQFGAKATSGILSGNTLAFVRNVGNSCKGVGGLLEFAGIRPERLLQVPTLKTCDFTRLYSGAAVSDWTHYQTLEYLDLSYNNLEGEIPTEFGDMVVLQVLDLAHNRLSGEIPDSLGQLRNLGVFDASHNKLRGTIPDSFSNLSFLVQIDLSNNELTGPIPSRGQLSTLPASQYADNPGLCGVPLPPCQSSGPAAATLDNGVNAPNNTAPSYANTVVLGVLVSIALLCVVIVWAIAVRARRKEVAENKMLNSLQAVHAATTWKIGKEKEALSINVATFQRQLRKLTFSQLIEATDGFSSASLIGSGGFGEVFKATLKDGSTVAVKKLIPLSYQGDREFVAEMETLGKIKHTNLVPMLGYCKIGEERLLVYEYMSHGSLDDALHCNKLNLNWTQRKRIARGAAKGLSFLHHSCIPHIIHRDMKSSNVLLDHEMEARVSDFGMARLISALDTHLSVSTLAGTPGYVPPEYYQSFRCTSKGDVYSFGVVMLELVTGRRPADKEEFGETNLVGWVKMKVREGNGRDVIDAELVLEASEEEKGEFVRFLDVAVRCVEDFASRRPSMMQVVAMLKDLKAGDGGGGVGSIAE